MFGPLTKRGSVSRRRLPAMAASGIAAAGLSVGVFMTSPALAADNHPAKPAHPAPAGHGDHGGPSAQDASSSSVQSGPDGSADSGTATAGSSTGPKDHKGPKPPKPGHDDKAGSNAAAGPAGVSSPQAAAAQTDGPASASADPASAPSGGDKGPKGGDQGAKPDKTKSDQGAKADKPKADKPKADKPKADKPKAGKSPKAGPTAAGGCSEDSFLGSASPASGSVVTPGSRISATYSDEKVISTTMLPTLTLTGPGVDMQLPIDNYLPAKTVLLTAPLPSAEVLKTSGTYVATLKAWDGDQNKAGGDCGVASWSFQVTVPNTPVPPVTPTPPVSPPSTPPANTPSTPPAAPTVPTQVLGVTLTPPTPPAAPTATVTPGRLAFTGDETRVLSEAGLLLVAGGCTMIARSQRRRFARSKKR